MKRRLRQAAGPLFLFDDAAFDAAFDEESRAR
jgi:hypothetical protein